MAISLVHKSISPGMTKKIFLSISKNRQIVGGKVVKCALKIFEGCGWMIFWDVKSSLYKKAEKWCRKVVIIDIQTAHLLVHQCALLLCKIDKFWPVLVYLPCPHSHRKFQNHSKPLVYFCTFMLLKKCWISKFYA